MLQNDADFHACYQRYQFHLSVSHYATAIRALLELEIDVSLVFDKQSGFHFARNVYDLGYDKLYSNLFQLLISYGYKPDIQTLCTLVRFGYYKSVELLIDYGLDINNDPRILLIALDSGFKTMINLLMKNGAKVNWEYVESHKNTHLASSNQFLFNCGFSAEEVLKLDKLYLEYDD